jgi:hypothetical protein
LLFSLPSPAGRPTDLKAVAMSSPRPVRPSRTWFWVAGALLAVAVACIIVAIASFVSVSNQVKDFQRVVIPGSGPVTFTSTGDYLVFFEGPGQGRGRARLLLRSASTGQAVRIGGLSGKSESYTLGGHSGQAVASVTITRAGRYELATAPLSGPPPADVAVGRGLGGGIVRGILFILAAVLLFIAALITGLITGIRRSRDRRRMAAPAWGPPPYGTPGPPPPGSMAPGSMPPGASMPPPGWMPPAPGAMPPAPGSMPPPGSPMPPPPGATPPPGSPMPPPPGSAPSPPVPPAER